MRKSLAKTTKTKWLEGQTTLYWLSNKLFRRFNKYGEMCNKSHWTVTRQLSKVTRPLADCQTTFFRRFKQLGKIFKKKCWTVTRQRSEVTRPSADCQITFFGRFKQFGKILKIVTKRSRDSGRRSRDRRPTVKQRFLDVSSNKKIFWKRSLDRRATVGGGHGPVGRLSNNVFRTFQAIRKFFEKSHWTVTWQWSEVTRPSPDCQTTFFGRVKQLGKVLKKVTERSRDRCRRSRDRRLTVKHLQCCCYLMAEYRTSMRAIALPNRLNIILTLLCIRMYDRSIVGQSSEGHVTVAWPSRTYVRVYMNERKKREYLRRASNGHRHVVPSAVSLAGFQREFLAESCCV